MADERTDEELIGVVEAFVLRARRVLAHSLCADMEALGNLADSGWYAIRKDGLESIQRLLPSEETLESLAARVRPLILQKEPVQHGYVLNALASYLLRYGHHDQAAWCKELKRDWNSVDPATGDTGYFLSVTMEGSEELPQEITDAGLAGTWFYGDLVHADQSQIDKGKAFEIDQRYGAAAVRVAQLAILARDTLSFIRSLVDDGIIEISKSVLEGIPVKVEAKTVQLTGLYAAHPGTEVPGPVDRPVGENWRNAFPGTEDGQWIMRIPWGRTD